MNVYLREVAVVCELVAYSMRCYNKGVVVKW